MYSGAVKMIKQNRTEGVTARIEQRKNAGETKIQEQESTEADAAEVQQYRKIKVDTTNREQ